MGLSPDGVELSAEEEEDILEREVRVEKERWFVGYPLNEKKAWVLGGDEIEGK